MKAFTLQLDEALDAELESMCTRLARGGEKPSRGSVARSALRLGLCALAETAAETLGLEPGKQVGA